MDSCIDNIMHVINPLTHLLKVGRIREVLSFINDRNLCGEVQWVLF